MFHLDIKQASVSYSPLDGIRPVGLQGIYPIEKVGRVKIAESLTSRIAQVSLGELVLQASQHLIDRVLFIEVQVSHSLKILLYVLHTESLRRKSHVLHLAKIFQERIGLSRHAIAIDP